MEARVNGERWGGGNSSEMHHKFPDILAHVSNGETLHAGEVIGSGTVGTGCGLELGRYLNSGDVVELEIEKIGVLRNRVLRG
jgi:2-keto-4-pentenoate hydratase/2-oxohepta-3-ene-1,7-dioic acid hydratase in catechol pathway